MSRAFVFPGQGSQAVGMGVDLAAAFATARDVFGEVVVRHMGGANPQSIFPGYTVNASRFPGLFT